MFLRRCKRCKETFEHCGSCEPGRLYCGQRCSEAARAESERAARDAYNARDTAEGRELHRLEEKARRAQRAEDAKKIGRESAHADGVRARAPGSDVDGSAAPVQEARQPSRQEEGCASPEAPAPFGAPATLQEMAGFDGRVGDHRCAVPGAGLDVASLAGQSAAREVANVSAAPISALPEPVVGEDRHVEWVLVAWPGLLSAARKREGAEAYCPLCGRRGRIVRVVCLEDWRRWLRHGLEPPH